VDLGQGSGHLLQVIEISARGNHLQREPRRQVGDARRDAVRTSAYGVRQALLVALADLDPERQQVPQHLRIA
jgi:hypothetical protein